MVGVEDNLVGVVNQNKPHSPFDALPEGLQAVLEEEPNIFNVCLAVALEKWIECPFWCAWRSPKSLREERGYGTSIALWLGLVGVYLAEARAKMWAFTGQFIKRQPYIIGDFTNWRQAPLPIKRSLPMMSGLGRRLRRDW